MKLRIAAAVVALALPLSACSNADDEKAAEGVSKSLQQGDEGDLKVSKDDADCIGEKMVDELGRDKLVEYKIIDKDYNATDETADDMSEDDAGTTADVFQGCTDVKKLFLDAMGDSVPQDAKDCMDEKLTDDVMQELNRQVDAALARHRGAK